MASVRLQTVSKVYPGGVEAVDSVDLEIEDGEFFVAVGPSGSGKSTLLRLIAGLENPTAGAIWIGDQRVDELPPRDRDVAMVFQTPALYPHLNVFENLAFGLRARSIPSGEIKTTVDAVAKRLGLAEVQARMPRTLSGGQRQRVALGRAMARQPRVFLLDEPFSSLDAPLRAVMRAELAEIHQRTKTTTILVTHDQAEAMALGDRIAVVDGGRIVQVGAPLDVYDRPASRFVANFIGQPPMNLLPGVVTRNIDAWTIDLEGTESRLQWIVPAGSPSLPTFDPKNRHRVEVGFRAEAISLSPAESLREPSPDLLVTSAQVQRLDRLGHETLATIRVGSQALNMRLPGHDRHKVGDTLAIQLDLRRALWFDDKSGLALRQQVKA